MRTSKGLSLMTRLSILVIVVPIVSFISIHGINVCRPDGKLESAYINRNVLLLIVDDYRYLLTVESDVHLESAKLVVSPSRTKDTYRWDVDLDVLREAIERHYHDKFMVREYSEEYPLFIEIVIPLNVGLNKTQNFLRACECALNDLGVSVEEVI